MTWDITNRFPDWGETGESPPTGFFYEGGDQVNEKHLDYLWNSVKGLEDDVQAALNDIDSNGDGTVDKADSVVGGTGNEYTDSDAVSAVDGEVDNASTSVAGLDDTVAGKSDDGHDHTEASETQIPDSGLVENYVTSTEASSYTDVDAISAVDGEVNNAANTIAALDNVVANTASDNHDNNQHSTNYLAQSDYNPEADSDLSNLSASGNVSVSSNDLVDASRIGLYWDGTVAYGFEAANANNVSDQYSIQTLAGLEVGSSAIDRDIFAGGDLKAAGNKPFVIEHPSDNTKKLRHCAYEGPVSGGLIYRDQVEVVNGEASVDFPDYVTNGDFGADWVQSVTPKKHFGTGYLDTDTWTVKADSDGTYDVIVMGQRTDSQGLAGLGSVTTKDKDESWDEAADRFYGGATDVDGNEVATSNDEYRQTTLYAHAESQYESN